MQGLCTSCRESKDRSQGCRLVGDLGSSFDFVSRDTPSSFACQGTHGERDTHTHTQRERESNSCAPPGPASFRAQLQCAAINIHNAEKRTRGRV
jgi:hypothetical protein